MSETLVSWLGAEQNLLVGSAFGDPSHPPVLLLHGGGQTRHAWGGTAEVLADAGFFAVTLDQRGHGQSDWSASGEYLFDSFVADLHAILPHFRTPPALVGASLGGLTGMLALGERRSPLFSALILVDVAHRLERTGVERIVSFMTTHLTGFASLEDAADAIAAYMPHRQRPKDLSGLAKNLRQGPDGRFRWHWDPRFIQGRGGPREVDLPQRLEEAARHLCVPTLLIRGRQSDVLSQEAADEFLQLAPHARYVDIKAAHMVAGDKNDVFTEVVLEFLQDVVRRE